MFFLVQRYILHTKDIFADQLATDGIVEQQQIAGPITLKNHSLNLLNDNHFSYPICEVVMHIMPDSGDVELSVELPRELVTKLVERKVLLWVCQRAELIAGVEPHTESTPLDDAQMRYRTDLNQGDLALAGVFWEACWTESIADLFYDAMNTAVREAAAIAPSSPSRLPYRLTTDPDSEGQIDRRRFLPIYEINGTNRTGDPEGVHGGSLARRLAYKMGLIRRLEGFPGRALLVVGAQGVADLEAVKIALDFVPSNNLVVILWPPDIPVPDGSELPSRIALHFLRGTPVELKDALVAIGAPNLASAPKLGVRYGRSTLDLREEDLFEVDLDFVLIQDRDFDASISDRNNATELERLWRSEPNDWTPFASNMVFRRHYRPFPGSNEDLASYITSQMQDMVKSDRVSNMTLTIPATSGSGITTALRQAAFLAARSGFPTLLCKPANQRFSVEKLGAFLTKLQERSREQIGGREELPALIIFDREHRGIEQVPELATALASRGRHALVVEVIPPIGEESEGPPARRPRGKHLTAREFRGVLDHDELRVLAEHFSAIYGPLGMPIPTLNDWSVYQEKQTVQTLSGERSAESLFWIALRFFVGDGNPHFDLAQWVGRTFQEHVKESTARLAVRYIAAFSSFGIAVPLVPLLRKAGTTKTLDTSIITTFRGLSESEDLLQWGDSEEYLHDQTIYFKHRLIAVQLLNQLGVNGWNDRLRECWGLLETLEASPAADAWLVETLVFEALRVDRFDSTMDGRLPIVLETLDHIPSVIAGRSAPTQHHWGRALGLRARQAEDTTEKVVYYSQAIDKLALACDLAKSERGREHPRNIYTSLGVMRSELSRVLRDDGQIEHSEILWQLAAAAFELAVRQGSDNFVVLSAYANRLIEHAREIDDTARALDEIASALSHLAQAEEAALLTDSLSPNDASYIAWERNKAWQVVDPQKAEHHIEALIDDGDEAGFILKAYRALDGITNEDWKGGTSPQLEQAFDILHPVHAGQFKNRSWRSIFLLYRVVSALRTRRHDFEQRLALLDQLDALGFRWHSGLRFAQAVLCYQTGDFLRGFNLFRSLRSGIVSGDMQPMRLASFWRDPSNPSRPRLASVRVQRVTSDWVAYGEISEMDGQQVLARPRWFEVQPKTGDVRPCHIAFETYGPLAVPTERRLISLID